MQIFVVHNRTRDALSLSWLGAPVLSNEASIAVVDLKKALKTYNKTLYVACPEIYPRIQIYK